MICQPCRRSFPRACRVVGSPGCCLRRAFLVLAWLGRVMAPLLQNTPPPLENTTTLVIQFMDLALIVPVVVLAGRPAAAPQRLGLPAGLGGGAETAHHGYGGQHDGDQHGPARGARQPPIVVIFITLTLANLVMVDFLSKMCTRLQRRPM